MNPISASYPIYKQPQKLSFGKLIPVSYVVIDGHTVCDHHIVEDGIKQFITQFRRCLPEDKKLRTVLYKTTQETTALSDIWQPIKKIGNNLVTGQDAIDLSKIWALSGISKLEKKQKASEFVKSLFANKHHEKLAIVADKTIVKGKTKYIIKNLFTTIY